MSDNFSNALGNSVLNYLVKTTAINKLLEAQDSFSIYTVTAASVIITLPTAASVYSGWNVTVKNTSVGNISVASADNIDGNSSVSLVPNQSLSIVNTGSTFKISGTSTAASMMNFARLPLVASSMLQGESGPTIQKLENFVAALLFLVGTDLEFSVPLPADYSPGTPIEFYWAYQASATTAGDFAWSVAWQAQDLGTAVTASPSIISLIGIANPATIQLGEISVSIPGSGIIGTESLNLKLSLTGAPTATQAHVIMMYLRYTTL